MHVKLNMVSASTDKWAYTRVNMSVQKRYRCYISKLKTEFSSLSKDVVLCRMRAVDEHDTEEDGPIVAANNAELGIQLPVEDYPRS